MDANEDKRDFIMELIQKELFNLSADKEARPVSELSLNTPEPPTSDRKVEKFGFSISPKLPTIMDPVPEEEDSQVDSCRGSESTTEKVQETKQLYVETANGLRNLHGFLSWRLQLT